MVVVGIDPGLTGAAVVLDDRRALFVVTWRRRTRKRQPVFAVSVVDGATVRESVVPRVSSVGRVLVGELVRRGVQGALIAVEDTFIGRNARSAVSVARSAGLVVGVVESSMNNRAAWCMAHEWRAVVLGLPRNAKRDRCKQASLDVVPLRVPNLVHVCGSVGLADHITDAAGVALWLDTTTNTNGTTNQRNEP